jgi:hypothetical protein
MRGSDWNGSTREAGRAAVAHGEEGTPQRVPAATSAIAVTMHKNIGRGTDGVG